MNTYKKYCKNVFVAQCDKQYKKGDVITVTSKHGKENESIVHNFLGYAGTKENPLYLYSIVRADGYNNQEHAKKKAGKYKDFSANAEKRSTEYYIKSTKDRGFLSLGEPIKVGHHSEKRHRKTIQQSWDNMEKSVSEAEKAEKLISKAEYWESRENDINLSMPESLEYYEYKLKEAKELHLFYSNNPEKREHSFSLSYAKKDVNEIQKNVELAVKLWGNEEELQQILEEKKEASKKKLSKNKSFDERMKKYGGFFHFGSDVETFKNEVKKLRNEGFLNEDEKVCHLGHGLYVPVKNKDLYF